MKDIAITLLVATGCGLIGRKIRFPAATLLCAVAGVACVHLLLDVGAFPTPLPQLTQLLVGAMVGVSVKRESLRELKTLWRALLVGLIGLCCVGALGACILHGVFGFSLETAILAGSPGGVGEMVLLADAFGGDAAVVAVFQVVRQIGICMAIPALCQLLEKRSGFDAEKQPATLQGKQQSDNGCHDTALRFLATLLAGGCTGVALRLLGVPVAFLLGGALGVAGFGVLTRKAAFPKPMRTVTQICLGCVTGLKITRDTLHNLPALLLPLLLIFTMLVLSAIAIAYVMKRLSRQDGMSCLLASSPGGVEVMTLLGNEMGSNLVLIAGVHLARIFAIIIFLPLVLKSICAG